MTKNGKLVQNQLFLKSEKGFSLPEILIVFLTISIIVVMAVPSSIRTLQLYRLDTSVSIIGNKLMEARTNAIKRNRTTWLKIDKTAKTAQIKSTNPAGEAIDVGFPERFPQGVILDETATVEISFDSMGRSSSGTQTFTIQESNSNKRKDITVSPAGKVSVGNMY